MANDNFDLPRPKDPVPSATSAVINDNAKVLDYVVNGTGSVITRTGRTIKTVEQAISDLDWSPVGLFADGVTFTKISDFAIDAFGVEWVYIGPDQYPKTVPPATVPTETNYKVVHVGSLQQLSGLEEPSKLDTIYTRTFDTVADMAAETGLTVGLLVKTKDYYAAVDGGGAEYVVSTSKDLFGVPLATGGLFANPQSIISPRQIGWNEEGGEDNYNLLDSYCKEGYAVNSYDSIYSLKYFYTQWEAGNSFPIAFAGDSTTDGATTTGHVASFIAAQNANVFTNAVTINESPNAYCAEIERQIGLVNSKATRRVYNAGMDSWSLRDGVTYLNAQKAFHRTFYGFASGLCNVDFSDVKGIVFAWGVSDIIESTVNEILASYEYKMELLITECFERGVQPFISNPVISQQRVGSTILGRDNDELISVIEAINDKLSKKYNLEVFSLRTPLETYAENAFETAGGYTEVMVPLPDGVHPNDKGHRMIGSYFTSEMCKLVKSLDGGEAFKFPAANPYLVTPSNVDAQENWLLVNNSEVVTRSSYYYSYIAPTSSQFLYYINIYCSTPMSLNYDMLSKGASSTSEDNAPKVTITNQPDNISRSKALRTDYDGVNNVSGSSYLIGRLDVGLNTVMVEAPKTPLGNTYMGCLRAEPMTSNNKILSNRNETGNTSYQNNYPNVEWLQNSINRIWSARNFKTENYAFSNIGTDRRIKFNANTLNNRDILFNGGRSFNDYDRFDLVRFNGAAVKVIRVTTALDGGKTELELGSFTSTRDFSTVFNGTFIINIQPSSSNTVLYVQYLNQSTHQLENIVGPITMTTNKIMRGGYSIGCEKNSPDSYPILISNITDEFEY